MDECVLMQIHMYDMVYLVSFFSSGLITAAPSSVGVGTCSSCSPFAEPIQELTWFVIPENISMCCANTISANTTHERFVSYV